MGPLHCLLWHQQRNKGWHTCIKNRVSSEQQANACYISKIASSLHRDQNLATDISKMTVCPAVSSQKAKSSARPRTEQANKVHTSSLTPALTGLWVGFCPDISYFLQATQWKGHICWNIKKNTSTTTPVICLKWNTHPGSWGTQMYPKQVCTEKATWFSWIDICLHINASTKMFQILRCQIKPLTEKHYWYFCLF